MKQPGACHEFDLLAALPHRAHIAIGCDCEDEGRCRRSSLRRLREVAVTGGFRVFRRAKETPSNLILEASS
jgi:hypothetical protein